MRSYKWAPSINKWHGQQTAHALIIGDAVPLCGAKLYSLGGAFDTAQETGSPVCGRCIRLIQFEKKRHAH